MWFDVLKDSKQVARTKGTVDWDNEAIPEKDETNCKEKLEDIRLSLLHKWKIPDCAFYRTTFGSYGPNVKNWHYHLKGEGKGAKHINNDWVFLGHEGVGNVVTISNTKLVANMTEEEACLVLKGLKYIADGARTRGDSLWQAGGRPLVDIIQSYNTKNLTRVIDSKPIPYSNISIKVSKNTGRTFFKVLIGEGAGMSHVNKVEDSFYAYLKTLL